MGGSTAVSPDKCNRDCRLCMLQFWLARDKFRIFPHVVQVSDAYARERAGGLVERARADQAAICSHLTHRGDVLQKIWVDSDSQQRAKIIEEIQPDLYKRSHPPLHIYLENDPCKQQNKRYAQLLPYLNLANLQEDPMKLLRLLHYRSGQELEAWVSFDMDQMRLTMDVAEGVPPEYNENCIILHGKRYGELIPWDRQETHEGRMTGYMMAIHALEAQAVLMNFLRRMLEKILALGADLYGSDWWKSLTAAAFHASGGGKCWSVYRTQPFSSAPTFCFDTLLTKAKAELRAALDHLRLLQTDPAYLQNLVNSQRKSHQALKLNNKDGWVALVEEVVCSPLSAVISFTTLVVELERAAHIFQDCKDSIRSEEPLPYDYKRALCVLVGLTVLIRRRQCDRLGLLLWQSPGFYQNYQLESPKGGERSGILLRDPSRAPDVSFHSACFSNDPLHYALFLLVKNEPGTMPLSTNDLAGFIDDRLTQNRKSETARVTQLLYDHLSQILIVNYLGSALHLHHPDIGHLCSPTKSDLVRLKKLDTCPEDIQPSGRAIQDMVNLLQECCSKPWPSDMRARGWIPKAQAIRAQVSAFWARVRETRWAQLQSIGMSAEDIVKDVSLLAADSSDEHLEDLRKEGEIALAEEARRSAKRSKPPISYSTPDSHSLQTVWGEASHPDGPSRQVSGEHLSLRKRAKEKSDPPTVSSDKPVEKGQEPTLIHISAESILLFAKMYPSAADGAAKATVKWTSFVAAMVDAGFTTVPTGGSAVHFNRNTADGGGAIVFHKPHPDSSISPIMLQIMGKRMAKWFGWNKDVFVERS